MDERLVVAGPVLAPFLYRALHHVNLDIDDEDERTG